MIFFRGPYLRKDYARLSEIRSILWSLSATVSPAMKTKIMESLRMTVLKIPNKPNIRYDVKPVPKDVSTILAPIEAKWDTCHHFLVYFNDNCTDLVHLLMPKDEVQPVCQMFSACTEERVNIYRPSQCPSCCCSDDCFLSNCSH